MITLDLSLENLYRQYYACRSNKRNTINALRFEVEQEKQLLSLREALINRTYQPTCSVCFFSTRPKLREIFAADFRDRVVHHLLVDYLERIWEPIFIHDSYACRKGNPLGNATVESFFHTLKAELVHGQLFNGVIEAVEPIVEYVEFYNRVRLHSSLNYQSPENYEKLCA